MSRKAQIRALDAQYTAAMTPAEAAAYLSDPDNGTVSYRVLNGNSLRIWAGSNPTDYTQIKAAAASSPVAEIAELLIQTPDSELDVNDARVAAMLTGLKDGGVLTQAGYDDLFTLAEVKTPLIVCSEADVVEARS